MTVMRPSVFSLSPLLEVCVHSWIRTVLLEEGLLGKERKAFVVTRTSCPPLLLLCGQLLRITGAETSAATAVAAVACWAD